MYAIIETGGKQYRVAEGDLVTVEKLDAEQGSTLEIPRVLMLAEGDSVQVGKPYLDDAKVTAEVAAHGKHDKVLIVKFKRRKHHLKRQGHRQRFTQLKITGISNG
ncbi:MAG: 50S ribosomal protein L21 [Halochromatium sp.]|nr:50S ribosomal protein L21 [Halochromatium sp.]